VTKRAGLDEVGAADAVQTLYAFVVGHCLFHGATTSGPVLTDLPAERYPHLRRVPPRAAEDEFEAGLAIWMRGLAT